MQSQSLQPSANAHRGHCHTRTPPHAENVLRGGSLFFPRGDARCTGSGVPVAASPGAQLPRVRAPCPSALRCATAMRLSLPLLPGAFGVRCRAALRCALVRCGVLRSGALRRAALWCDVLGCAVSVSPLSASLLSLLLSLSSFSAAALLLFSLTFFSHN